MRKKSRSSTTTKRAPPRKVQAPIHPGEILAEDFMASLPDLLLRDKKQFLEMMSAPRPFTGLKGHDVKIRLLGDFAIIHARITYTTHDGIERQGRYTDDYQRSDGKWVCVAANLIAEGL